MAHAETPERRTGEHDPEGRRRDVLTAARRLFASRGYPQTAIRAIAAEANVNQALVVTYFGGKEALFMEAVGRFEIPTEAPAGSIDGMGARLAHAYVDRWENMRDDDPWPALVRSAPTHQASDRLLRDALHEQLNVPLGQILGSDGDGMARNAMVQCLIAGMIMERYIYKLEPASSLPVATFRTALGNCLQHAISGPVAAATDAA